MSYQFFSLIAGIFLCVWGFSGICSKKVQFGIGRPAIFYLKFHDESAVALSISFLSGGIFMLQALLWSVIIQDDSFIIYIMLLCVIVVGCGVIIAFFIEFIQAVLRFFET
ncbi:MAG: hypothetical protein ACPG7F_09710 [Aggregatilineales bacterium]